MSLIPSTPLQIATLLTGMWVVIGAALAYASGWRWLASRYGCAERPAGESLAWQVYSIGTIGDSGVTGLRLCSSGLYLWANPFFRFMRPPLLIPWEEIRYGSERKILWQRTHSLKLAGQVSIRITDHALREMEPYLSDVPARLHRELEVPA